ncbi:uncharacterized protein LOC124352680 isoform X5 [Homalodisca vitripennis]|uniref:uncharacterized protein LOC124352680 isoform X5 n=1 Tax=Homalodisca vitripennis TaxID=197043 RepID=UPI001EEC118F|nr:uncharacterized protein LOC124352680 isoform X5 [Homalodisca vitripennis]
MGNSFVRRFGGGGGNSNSPKLLQPKASENPNLNKSETHINVKEGHDVVSPSRSDTVSKLSVPATSKRTKTAHQTLENVQPHNLALEGEEDETFEDAEENKSNLTVLAEDLDKLHLGTPGRNVVTSAASHEFVNTKQFRVNSLRLSDSDFLYESDDASDVSQNNSLNKSNYEVSPVLIKSSEHMSKSMEVQSFSEGKKELINVPMSSSVNFTESLSGENDFGIVNFCDISLSPNFVQPSDLQKSVAEIDITSPKENSKSISFQSPTDETTATNLEKSYADCKESSLSPFKIEFKENFAKIDSTPEVHISQTDDSMSLTSIEKDAVAIESVIVNSAFSNTGVSPVSKNKVEKDTDLIINTSAGNLSLSSLDQVNLVKSSANHIIDDEIKITEDNNANVNAEFNNSMVDSNTLTETNSNIATPKIMTSVSNCGSQHKIDTVLTTTVHDEVFSINSPV